MTLDHVDRLRRARELMSAKGYDTSRTVLACYSGAGFDENLQAAGSGPGETVAGQGTPLLVDVNTIYTTT